MLARAVTTKASVSFASVQVLIAVQLSDSCLLEYDDAWFV
jgi:hypothetical protein